MLFTHWACTCCTRACGRTGFVLTGGAGGEVRAWDLRSREMASNMKLHNGPISDLAVLSDDAHAVVASEDRSLSLW